jgi:hypothetical protein
MKVTLESTDNIVNIVNAQRARLWKGATADGIPVVAVISSIGAAPEHSAHFAEDLIPHASPSAADLAREMQEPDSNVRDAYIAFAERFGAQSIPVESEGIVWLSIIGALQLALRHPEFRGPSSKIVREFVRQMVKRFVDDGAPREAFEYGQHP